MCPFVVLVARMATPRRNVGPLWGTLLGILCINLVTKEVGAVHLEEEEEDGLKEEEGARPIAHTAMKPLSHLFLPPLK